MQKFPSNEIYKNNGKVTIKLEEISPLVSIVLLYGCLTIMAICFYVIKSLYGQGLGFGISEGTVAFFISLYFVFMIALYSVKALFHHYAKSNVHLAAVNAWAKSNSSPLWAVAITLTLGFFIYGFLN